MTSTQPSPTHLVIYALPNGNTIAQTIGCAQAEGRDWHFYIQHIGAQTRRLRTLMKDRNLVVAYVEAGGRSWPTWRRKQEDSGAKIVALVDSIRGKLPGEPSVSLVAHSGGGSLIFGFLNQCDPVPDWIERIVFLDADYGYDETEHHGDKFIAWLNASPKHHLGVVAYDDRRIKVNGKLVVGPTGGTYRRSHDMAERLARDVKLDKDESSARTLWDGTRRPARPRGL